MLSYHYEACCKSNCEQWAAKCYKKCLLLHTFCIGYIKRDTVWLVIFVRDLFSRFSQAKSHSRKLKPWNFSVHMWSEWTAFQSPAYLYSRQQKRVSECAFDGYCWCYPENRNASYVSTDTWTRQRCKSESRSNRYYERPGYEATFLAALEQRTEIAIRVFVDIRSAFIRNAS